MSDRTVGVLLMLLGLVGIVVYGYLVFFSSYGMLLVEVTAFAVVAVVLAIFAWIGYTLTTVIPEEDFDMDVDVDDEWTIEDERAYRAEDES